VSYVQCIGMKYKRDVVYVYDLELPPDFLPFSNGMYCAIPSFIAKCQLAFEPNIWMLSFNMLDHSLNNIIVF
jgi:hypothetical protein